MPRFLRDQSLPIVLLVIFAATLVGQSLTGHRTYNREQREHGEATVGYAAYLRSGHFVESVFENWESEFLQMGAYVLFTAFLFSRGSAESSDPDKGGPEDADPRAERDRPGAPWPVRRGGIVLALYEHSLALALFLLFLIAFVLHAAGGARAYNAEAAAHGGETISTLGYVATAQFWFESLQNWQSEFFSIAVLVVLSIFLRQRGSPESKPVAAAHGHTGAG